MTIDMEILTSKLIGAALDYAVAQCEKLQLPTGGAMVQTWPHYSSDWAQGGPIIEREGLMLYPTPLGIGGLWRAEIRSLQIDFWIMAGDTPLIAAMRCYVATKLGDEIEIPERLVQ